MTMPQGFKYAGVAAGMKANKRKDVGLIVSDRPAVCAGVTTTNKFAAACVIYDRGILRRGQARAIIVNTKFANACTGKPGLADNRQVAQAVEKEFGGPVLTASTGIIGKRMPVKKILKVLPALKSGLTANHDDFAAAILTTDLTLKKITKKLSINGRTVVIAGEAKGSGMIHPNMATMLAFVTTDAKISRRDLQVLIQETADLSFNQITVDGDTSTNDMLLALANGASGVKVNRRNASFRKALLEVLIYLAKEIARDGEGATKLMEVQVTGARNDREARVAARTIAGSPLLKCAVYGGDDNWGRVFAALGRSGIKFDPEIVKMQWSGLKSKEVFIKVNIGSGRGEGKAWGCDLTEGYIKINTNYN